MTEKPRAKHARGYVHSVDHHSDLELALAADILGTVMIPTWDEIGKSGAIVVLRAVLNHFLERAIEQEQKKAEYVLESADFSWWGLVLQLGGAMVITGFVAVALVSLTLDRGVLRARLLVAEGVIGALA